MRKMTLILLTSLFVGCGSEPRELAESSDRPTVPPPMVNQGEDLIEHPWVRSQGIQELSQAVVDDLGSLKQLHQHVASERSFEDFSLMLMAGLTEIQQDIDVLNLCQPEGLYQSLNIPPLNRSHYPIPWEFQVYRRYQLDKTELGFPVYLDLRVFENVESPDICQWHLKQLETGESSFQKYLCGDWVVTLGRGSKNPDFVHAAHGFSLEDRGVFLAFRKHGDRLFVWHLDAPWENAQHCLPIFTQILNHPLAMLPDDTDLNQLIR